MDGIALPIILLAIGVAAFFLEVFVPSGGLISVVGIAAIIGSVYMAFANHGSTTGTVFLGLAAILSPAVLVAGFYLLPRTAIGRKLMLAKNQSAATGYVAQDPKEDALVGKTGVTISTLRPSGEARIDDRKYDVITEGEMIDEGSRIEVYHVSGNRIVVRRATTSQEQKKV